MWLTACLSVRWVDACTWTAFLGPQGVSAGVTQYFTSHPLHLPGNGTLHGSKMASGWPLLTFDVSVFQSSAQYNGRVPSQGFILDLYQSREIFFVFYCQTVKNMFVLFVVCSSMSETWTNVPSYLSGQRPCFIILGLNSREILGTIGSELIRKMITHDQIWVGASTTQGCQSGRLIPCYVTSYSRLWSQI